MNLQSLAMQLQKDGVGRIGTSIFIADMPADAKSGVLLRGPRLGSPIDYELPGYRNTHFNVSVRGQTYKEGEALMKKAMASLTITETEIPGMDIRYIRPQTDPIPFPLSDAKIFEFLVIFEAVYVIV